MLIVFSLLFTVHSVCFLFTDIVLFVDTGIVVLCWTIYNGQSPCGYKDKIIPYSRLFFVLLERSSSGKLLYFFDAIFFRKSTSVSFFNTFYFDCFFLETLASNIIDEKFKRLSPK